MGQGLGLQALAWGSEGLGGGSGWVYIPGSVGLRLDLVGLDQGVAGSDGLGVWDGPGLGLEFWVRVWIQVLLILVVQDQFFCHPFHFMHNCGVNVGHTYVCSYSCHWNIHIRRLTNDYTPTQPSYQ